MIVVSVFLLSAVDGQTSELARMTIDNIGGTNQRGDYRTRTLRGRSSGALHQAMRNGTVQREGKVLGHERQRLHVWNLVAKALAGMGYGGEPPQPIGAAEIPRVSEFLGWIADHFQEKHVPALAREPALAMAVNALEMFESSEGRFGDPDFAWDRDGAICIAHDEIQHWESVS